MFMLDRIQALRGISVIDKNYATTSLGRATGCSDILLDLLGSANLRVFGAGADVCKGLE